VSRKFYEIRHYTKGSGEHKYVVVYPEFISGYSADDLMTRGGKFYAIWDREAGLWSTNENDVTRIVDNALREYVADHPEYKEARISRMSDFSTNLFSTFQRYTKAIPANYHQLDTKPTFSNTPVKKEDYISRRLPYALEAGDIAAYEELVSTLYSPEERRKLEWAIGSIVAGDSKNIQKFIVLFGQPGTGKSTILRIIEKMFPFYTGTFSAKALGNANSSFATGPFRSNPLIAIDDEGDLSKIDTNSLLNSIAAHEEIIINAKYVDEFPLKVNAFMFIGTNKPVKITGASSGLIRRLIDVRPTGITVPKQRYDALYSQVDFELGAIAHHCLEVYRSLGKDYYRDYKPLDMLSRTNDVYNFVADHYLEYKNEDMVSVKTAYAQYKQYCSEAGLQYVMIMREFREELKGYFSEFKNEFRDETRHLGQVCIGFRTELFDQWSDKQTEEEDVPSRFIFDKTESLLDTEFADMPAQYASTAGTPAGKWSNVQTKLRDLDSRQLHYVKVPVNYIVIDFDLKDENGEKSFEKNLEAANKWPATYAELSKSGKGIHLHYIYDGDPAKLKSVYDTDIEVKVFTGNSSLRRKLTKCNDIPLRHIDSGLPLKGEAPVVNFDSVKSERSLRDLIYRNLRKEIHPGTKPSVDFIYTILEDAYKSGLNYDVTDLRPRVLAFANKSTHHGPYCCKLVSKMKFQSENQSENIETIRGDDALYFFDVEVFPNLFVVVYKKQGGNPVKLINPSQYEIEVLVQCRLIGFNCRRYDNHILYGRLLGYDNMQLYNMSQRIISGSKNAFISDAYNLSYTDVYDFSSKKQSLKKFEIELGIHHQELGLPWDEPVPEELWETVADYCVNDVIATEAVFEARKADFVAREILAEVAGMTVNDTTNSLTQRIIFGTDRNPQNQFNYRNMGEPDPARPLEYPGLGDPDFTAFQDGKPIFPGYKYEFGKSEYRGEDPKEGGYVYAEYGMYGNVALLDIESMHPSSVVAEELFGPVYTARFKEILDARKAVKHKRWDEAGKLLDGALKPYIQKITDGEMTAKDLATALKIAINSVYGLTSAKFDNRCRDKRNVDNIVAKRGALFMINLKHEVQNRGYTVAHIKTDSIKIPDADMEIIEFVQAYGKLYGYNFVHEATYEKMCLVNDAVYVAKYASQETCSQLYGYIPDDNQDHPGAWTATGAQFQVPYVFKTMFSHEPVEFQDLCETKTVSTALYLDMNEDLGPEEHNYQFVGKAGAFCPILPGKGGGELLREKDGKYYAATGTKGYRWLEAEAVQTLNLQDSIDESYYERLCDEAKASIENYGDFTWFASEDPYMGKGDRHIWPF